MMISANHYRASAIPRGGLIKTILHDDEMGYSDTPMSEKIGYSQVIIYYVRKDKFDFNFFELYAKKCKDCHSYLVFYSDLSE